MGGAGEYKTRADKHVQIIFHLPVLILRRDLINCNVKRVVLAVCSVVKFTTFPRGVFHHI